MRRRLIITIVSTVLITGLIIGVPLLVISSIGIRERAVSLAKARAQRTAELIEMRVAEGQPNDVQTLEPYNNANVRTTITFPDGTVEVLGTPQTGPFVVTGSGASGGVKVSVQQSTTSIASPWRVAGNTAAIIAVAMVAAFFIALRRSRRLADLFDDLAADASRIGSGDLRPARRYGYPELDQVADGLDASTQRVSELLRTERELVADVTHQLRTPLTAIGLRIDEVAEAAERGDAATARVEALAAHEQVDRLTRVIDELLAASRLSDSSPLPFHVDDVLAQQEHEWAPLFATGGRTLTVQTTSDVVVNGSPGPLAQIIATLLENALVHGGGPVSVRVVDSAGLAEIQVRDEGPGIDPQLGSSVFERNVSGGSGSGLGLSLARALAEHMGGRLELVSSWPTVFGVFLPQLDDDGVGLEPPVTAEAAGPAAGPEPSEPTGDAVDSSSESSSVKAASAVAGNTQRR